MLAIGAHQQAAGRAAVGDNVAAPREAFVNQEFCAIDESR